MSSLNDVRWRRSSRCDNSGGSCVEVAFLGAQVVARDSKDSDGAPLVFDRAEWAAFIDGVKLGDFDPQ